MRLLILSDLHLENWREHAPAIWDEHATTSLSRYELISGWLLRHRPNHGGRWLALDDDARGWPDSERHHLVCGARNPSTLDLFRPNCFAVLAISRRKAPDLQSVEIGSVIKPRFLMLRIQSEFRGAVQRTLV